MVTPPGLPGWDDVQAEEMGSESRNEPAQTRSQTEEEKKRHWTRKGTRAMRRSSLGRM